MNETSETSKDAINYLSLKRAGEELGVARGTLYYYIRQLNIPMKKFELDRKTYISVQDLQRIKDAKQMAAEGQR
jgi:hypothetical protein